MPDPEGHIHAFAQTGNTFVNEHVLLCDVRASDTSTHKDIKKRQAKTQAAVDAIRAVLNAYEAAYLQPVQAPEKEQLL